MAGLAAVWLVAIFAVSAGAIWVAGISLSNSTDALDTRLGLGAAIGGLILLSFATDLPELVITVTASASGHADLAVGNLVGGIAIQTVVLAACDASVRHDRPLSFLAGSLIPVLEAVLVITVVVLGMMTMQLPASANVAGVSPGTIAIVLVWLGGLLLVRRAQTALPWKVEAPESRPGRARERKRGGAGPQPMKQHSTAHVAGVFAGAAVVTAVAGVFVEKSGSELAGRLGLSGAVFGATILAAATALPELSTGLQSVKIGDHQLAFSDIFGGNAVLMVLFLLADLVSGKPALPDAQPSDVWMAGLGAVVTGAYAVGLVMRPRRRIAGLVGPDSLAVLVAYALGIVGLAIIT
jgi:cation:H+ antiporter